MCQILFRLVSGAVLLILLMFPAGCAYFLPSDLIPSSIYFDNNVLHVTLKNEGKGIVPENKGKLVIFIDRHNSQTIPLGTIPDQSFRSPGGVSDVATRFRAESGDFRVLAWLDPDMEISDANRQQNTLSRTLTAPIKLGASDLTVTNLSLDDNDNVEIRVHCHGNCSAEDVTADFRVFVDGEIESEFTATMSFDNGGGGVTVHPDPPVNIDYPEPVLVEFTVASAAADIDNTNNWRKEYLPLGPPLMLYSGLLSVPKIGNNTIWEGPDGPKNYFEWTSEQREDLGALITLLEHDTPWNVGPPHMLANNYFSATRAWQIYCAHVAHVLWVELHSQVSWSLFDFTDEQLRLLLDSRKLMKYKPELNLCRFESGLMGNITSWQPAISYDFLSKLNLIKPDQLQTIYAFTDWARSHVIHVLGDQSNAEVWGYQGPPPADRILYPLDGSRHVSAGCWGTTGLYAAVLRSVNIPVESGGITLNNGLHSRPIFVTVGRSMPHADDVYSSILIPSGNVIPASEIFYTLSEMDSKFLNPTVQCSSVKCNTPAEQASYNAQRDHLEKAAHYLADDILYFFAVFGPDGLNAYLQDTNPTDGDDDNDYAYPYISFQERMAIIDAAAMEIEKIGNGDIEAGKLIVRDRVTRFHDNK